MDKIKFGREPTCLTGSMNGLTVMVTDSDGFMPELTDPAEAILIGVYRTEDLGDGGDALMFDEATLGHHRLNLQRLGADTTEGDAMAIIETRATLLVHAVNAMLEASK